MRDSGIVVLYPVSCSMYCSPGHACGARWGMALRENGGHSCELRWFPSVIYIFTTILSDALLLSSSDVSPAAAIRDERPSRMVRTTLLDLFLFTLEHLLSYVFLAIFCPFFVFLLLGHKGRRRSYHSSFDRLPRSPGGHPRFRHRRHGRRPSRCGDNLRRFRGPFGACPYAHRCGVRRGKVDPGRGEDVRGEVVLSGARGWRV